MAPARLPAALLFAALLLLAACGEERASALGPGSSSSNGQGGSPACGPASGPITLSTGDEKIYGTLQLPDGCGPHPTVLIHAGSGPTTRDGNSWGSAVKNDSLKLLAEGLSSRGVASVRYDKRGIAASQAAGPAKEEDYSIEMLVADLGAWLTQMRSDERFARITIAGHSEGSLIGILAAQQSPPDALASLAGVGRPAGELLHEQLAPQLSAELLAEADAIIAQLEMGNTVDEVSTDLMVLFRPSVQPYLISWLKYDPAVEFAKLSMPLQVVQGTTDIQVKVLDAELLAAANKSAELVIIDDMSHTLKEASLDPDEQNKAYTDPSLPVMVELFDALTPLAQGD